MPDEVARLRDALEQTQRALIRERARHRETAEALLWAEEKERVLRRVIERLAPPHDEEPRA